MKIIDWMNKQNKKMDIWDMGLTKWTMFFFTLFLVKFFPELLSLDWYVYLVVALILAIRPLYHFFGKTKK